MEISNISFIQDKYFEELREIIPKNREKIFIIAGAGSSIILGLPTWKNLLLEMAEIFKFTDIKEDNINRYIKKYKYFGVAELIYKSRPDALTVYNDFLKNKMKSVGSRYGSLHQNLLLIFNRIITTNFDSTFENAFNTFVNIYKKHSQDITELKITIKSLSDFKLFELFETPYSLTYLHGNVIDDNYIFREEEYKTYYPTYFHREPMSHLELFLQDIFTSYTTVFIGFSFNDECFTTLYKKIMNEEKIRREREINTYGNLKFKDLPSVYVILKEENLNDYIYKSKIDELLNNDYSIINRLFESKSVGYVPKGTYQLEKRNFINNQITLDKLDNIVDEYHDNINRIDLFKEYKFKSILIKEHNELDELLELLIPTLGFREKGEEDDAKYK